MKSLFLFLLSIPILVFAQKPILKEGVPDDLDKEKIIILKHEPIEISVDKKADKESKYIYLRQVNHNRVIEESNNKLKTAALEYPFGYAISSRSHFEPLLKAGYKYVLQSRVYKYDHLKKQPNEGELILFEYYIFDTQNNVAFKVFELDEMKVYDSKLLMKRLIKAVKKKFPEAGK